MKHPHTREPRSAMSWLGRYLIHVLGLMLLGVAAETMAHNLQTRQAYIYLDKATQTLLDARLSGWTPGNPLLQPGDEIGLINKVVPDPSGTTTGVGGYVDFYVPNGTTVVDVAYMVLNASGELVRAPMNGQSPIAIGAGPIGPKVTNQLIGLGGGYTNILGVTENPVVDSTGLHRGTIAGVYGDTGIFYSTDPDTAWGSWQAFTNGANIDSCGSKAYYPLVTGFTITNNSGDVVVPCNKWDAGQLFAWGVKGTSCPIATYPGCFSAPIVDYNDGRGNIPWGFGSGVAGPQSGYAWAFDWNYWNGLTPTAQVIPANMKAAMGTGKFGPWQRIKYEGSRIAYDQAGSLSTTIGFASVDGETTGTVVSPAAPLPATVSQTDFTSVKTIRYSIGQQTQNKPMYVWVKLKIDNLTKAPAAGAFLDAQGCPFFHADTFGGDAGGTENGKDHLWRYYEPTVFQWDGCYGAGKTANKEIAKVGDTMAYTIKTYNLGTQTLTNVKVTDTLPSGVAFVSASPAQNTGPNPLQWVVGTLQPGQKFEATVNVKVTGTGQLSNCIAVSSFERPTQTTCDITVASATPYLVQAKTASPTNITPGADVTFTVTTTNLGTGSTGSPVVITDNLPLGFTYKSPQTPTASINGGPITPTVNSSNVAVPSFSLGGSIQPGQTAVVTFIAKADANLAAGQYCNTYTVTQNGIPQTSGSLACVTVGGGQIGDTIFRDWNGDGKQDPGEGGMPGVSVYLCTSSPCTSGNATQTVTTDSNGNYLFSGLSAGNYFVGVPEPNACPGATNGGVPCGYAITSVPGDVPGTTSTYEVTLIDNQKVLTADWGYKPGGVGKIGNEVFTDVNADGIFGPGDTGIASAVVDLYFDSNGNGVIDAGEPKIQTATANGSGVYGLTNLDPTLNYIVQAQDGVGSVIRNAFAGPPTITTQNPWWVTPSIFSAQGNDVTTADFGYYYNVAGFGSIGDTVFIDANGDGQFTSGEPGLANINVWLYIDFNGDGNLDPDELVDTRQTDANGNYLFENLGPASYIVVVDTESANIPAGYHTSIPSISKSLAAGENYLAADFPFTPALTKAVSPTGAVSTTTTLTYSFKPRYVADDELSEVRVIDPLPANAANVLIGAVTPQTGATVGGYVPIAASNGQDPGPPQLDTAITVNTNTVTQGGTVTVTLNVKQNSGSTITNVSASPIDDTTDGSVAGGSATCTQPASASVASGGGGTNFVYTCTVNSAAEYYFTASASNGSTTDWPNATSQSVLAVAPGQSTSNIVTWNLGSNSAEIPGFGTTVGSVVTGVYAFQGTAGKTTTQTFSRYGIKSQLWIDLAPYGAVIGKGGALTANGSSLLDPTTTVYGLEGNKTKKFKRYKFDTPNANTWVGLKDADANVDEGGAAKYVKIGGTEYVFAMYGNGTAFGRYSVSGNTWTAGTALPATVKKGGALTAWNDGTDTWIYALQGNTLKGFYRCNASAVSGTNRCVSGTAWETRASTPQNVAWGGALTTVGNNIYALFGNGTKNFYRYNTTADPANGILANTWTKLTDTPGNVSDGGALTTDGQYVYAFQGKNTGFWRYDTTAAKPGWELLRTYAIEGQGASLAYVWGVDPNNTSSLTASKSLVTSGDSFNVKLRLTSDTLVSGPITPSITAVATNGASVSVSGCGSPTPANVASIPAKGSAEFQWTCTASAGTLTSPDFSSLKFTNTTAGGFAQATSNSVLVSPALSFTTRLSTLTAATYGCAGTNTAGIYVTAGTLNSVKSNTVQNTGNATANCGSSLGKTVWADTNGDGTQNAGEPGLAGVKVCIDTNGNGACDVGEESAITDANGNYSFTGKTAGSYTIIIDPSTYPTGYTPTTPTSRTDSVGTNSSNETFNFGLQPPGTASIGDNVWLDADDNGTLDAGETPLPNIKVKLYRDLNGDGLLDPGDPLVDETTTDANGNYLFSKLPAGKFLVVVDETNSTVTLPYPYSSGPTTANLGNAMDLTGTQTNPRAVTLTAGQAYLDADFGYNWAGQVGDKVVYDPDESGPPYPSTGDNGVPNVTLVLVWDQNGNGVADIGEPALGTAFTDANGAYLFDRVPPGKYVVQAAGQTVVSPNPLTPDTYGTMVPTAPYGENYAVELVANGTGGMSVLTADFGYVEAAVISGNVFNDANQNGVLDPGEIGLGNGTSNVVVYLYEENNPTPVQTYYSSAGAYRFLVPPGKYRVGYQTTQTTSIYNLPYPTTILSYQTTAVAGQEVTDLNFGVTSQTPPNPVADLSIYKTDSVDTLPLGGTTTYTITVSNGGPDPANGAVFSDPAQYGLDKTSITCGSAAGGAVCPSSPLDKTAVEGTGVAIPTLPSGGSLVITIQANVTAQAGDKTVYNAAFITAPAGTTDTDPTNNASDDTDRLPYFFQGTVFRDNGAGGGIRGNGLQMGTEPVANEATLNGLKVVLIDQKTNLVERVVNVCPTTLPLVCIPGTWVAEATSGVTYKVYITADTPPSVNDPMPTPTASVPAPWSMTGANINSVGTTVVSGGVIGNILPASDSSTYVNFGVIRLACPIN